MAKPSITKRITKTAALTYSELDTNFQNLADATLTLRAGTGGTNVTADLNGTITLVAGTNVTLTGDNSAKTITVNASSGSQNLFSTIAVAGQSNVVADSTSDTLTLAAGTGITVTTDSGTDTITITNSASAQNTFSTIAVAGQSDVVADSTSDTLTLVAGSNVTLTTNSTTDTVTIAAASPSTNATTVTITDSSTTNTDYSLIFGDTSGNLRKDAQLNYNPYSQTLNASSGFNIAALSAAITLSQNGNSQFSAAGGYLVLSGESIRILNGPLRLSSYSNSASVSSPENGMIIYNTTSHKFQGYANGAWVDLH